MGADRRISELIAKNARASDLPRELPERLDGRFWKPAKLWDWSRATFTTSQSAAGIWLVSRTNASGGAESTAFALYLSDLLRTVDGRGLKVIDLVIAYEISAGPATTVDLDVRRTTFANGSGPASSSLFTASGGTLTMDSSHVTNANRVTNGVHLMTATIPVGSGFYETTDSAQLLAELNITVPNNCLFKLYGGGFHVAHDYL